jgi:hypothetical protein
MTELINYRRVLALLVSGSLLLVAAGAQASADETDTASLAIAEQGLALGLAAAGELAVQAETGELQGEGIEQARAALESVLAKLEEKTNNGRGRGPERAIEVHRALLAGDLPSSIGHDDDSIPGLARAYGHMRAQLKGEGRGQGAAPAVPAAPAP